MQSLSKSAFRSYIMYKDWLEYELEVLEDIENCLVNDDKIKLVLLIEINRLISVVRTQVGLLLNYYDRIEKVWISELDSKKKNELLTMRRGIRDMIYKMKNLYDEINILILRKQMGSNVNFGFSDN